MAAPELGEIQETLLIPLYGRARDAAESGGGVLKDTKAVELVDAIDYDFTEFRGPSLGGAVLRASIFDGYIREFLQRHPEGTVVDLGCGLSTRYDRLDNGRLRWFDLDVDDTMTLRRRFFDDSDRYTMIAASLFDPSWHEQVTERGGPLMLVSEAVLLYFSESEVFDVLRSWARRFPDSPLALDTGGRLMMRSQDRNPVFKAVPARMKWEFDDPNTLEPYGLRLEQSRTLAQPQPEVATTWPARYRHGMRLIGWTPMVTGYRINLFALTS
ncbi:class I SAM-dependent methyltransferase [Gordonia sp. NB41Y]|uniref:class I SAM-dependent methyltransferase n=1 Tax=Gordonia sp. NB41Y TaxID=875808 RepID=UPI0002BE9060|nr:class I SAM-dependent methyltransferase [Gordonia sp. NB41Y]EMP15283.1 methyltransferase [Gordonia sp. NB41Y]WLP92852.1 class I SAM-dependent methyltransferase [Gordonia sp. NB41Y]